MTFDWKKNWEKTFVHWTAQGTIFSHFPQDQLYCLYSQKLKNIIYFVDKKNSFMKEWIYMLSCVPCFFSCIPLYKHESYINAASCMLITQAWHIKENPGNMPTLLSLVIFTELCNYLWYYLCGIIVNCMKFANHISIYMII